MYEKEGGDGVKSEDMCGGGGGDEEAKKSSRRHSAPLSQSMSLMTVISFSESVG